MVLGLARNPIEVRGDFHQLALRFARAEALRQPFDRIAVALGIVAPTDSVTQGDDVRRQGSGTIGRRERYPVIGGNRVPQSSRTTADSATAAEIFKSYYPVLALKIIGQLALYRLSSLMLRLEFGRVVSPPLARTFSSLFRVLSIPFTSLSAIFVCVLFIILLTVFPIVFYMSLVPLLHLHTAFIPVFIPIIAGSLPAFFGISPISLMASPANLVFIFSYLSTVQLATAFAIIHPPVASVLPVPFRIVFRALSAVGVVAFTTQIIDTVKAGFVEFEHQSDGGECPLTLTANLGPGIGDIQHGDLLKSHPKVEAGTGLGSPVVKRVITPLQARLYYTTGGA